MTTLISLSPKVHYLDIQLLYGLGHASRWRTRGGARATEDNWLGWERLMCVAATVAAECHCGSVMV